MTKQDKQICSYIGHFYLTKHKEDYDAAEKEIQDTGFVRVECCGDMVIIEARRVGLLIGKRGTNVDALQVYLSKKIFVKECVDSVEDVILCPIYNKRDWDRGGPYSAYDKQDEFNKIQNLQATSEWVNNLVGEWEQEDTRRGY